MRSKLIAGVSFTVLALLTVGCGTGPVLAPSPTTSALHLSGKVHGGQNPVAGASVYLYAAGTSGYGGASVSLLGPSPNGDWPTQQDGNGNYYVTTDINGNFSLTGNYTCTSGQQVYIYAVGGNTGGGANSSMGLLAVLGNCPGSGDFSNTYSYVIVNEISTVAAAYAMAGYATDATHVSSPNRPLALTGIANAFANAANLVDITTSSARTTTPAGNGTVPAATITTLGNILATCVNSADTTGSTPAPSNACSSLFSTVLSNGGTGNTATDAATEAIYIAHNPGYAVGGLFSLPTGMVPFPGGLTAPPNDFSLSITFTSGGGINSNTYSPYVVIDAGGNAWLSDEDNAYIIGLSPLGVPLAGSPFSVAGLTGPYGLAIDPSGYLWVVDSNAQPSTVTKIDSSGDNLGSISLPQEAEYVASDGTGNIWSPSNSTASNTYYVSQISDSSVSLVQSLTTGGLNAPYNVAVDSMNDVWVTNTTGSLTEFTGGTTPNPNSPFTGGGIATDQPINIALDSQNNVWVQGDGNTLSALNSSGVALTNSPFVTADGVTSGGGLAIDGQGRAFTLSQGLSSSSGNYYTYVMAYDMYGNQLLGTTGLLTPQNYPDYIALDGSGDLWLACASGVSEMIGVAAPVVTPLAANLVSPYSAPASLP